MISLIGCMLSHWFLSPIAQHTSAFIIVLIRMYVVTEKKQRPEIRTENRNRVYSLKLYIWRPSGWMLQIKSTTTTEQ